MKKFALAAIPLALAGVGLLTYNQVYASDHDDGETDLKSRALNLTDHFAFNSPSNGSDMVLVTNFNPRSLPGKQYFMSTSARYEQHISKVADKTKAPTVTDDVTFRYEAGAPAADGTQSVTLTMLKSGVAAGTATGKTTSYAQSKAGTPTVNNSTIGTVAVKWSILTASDPFTFDVIRFFQVRAFLAQRFFGGAGGTPDGTASLVTNCRGDTFLGAEGSNGADADPVNLWNPPSCAPDFTKNLNVLSIVTEVKTSDLGGTVFDTWDTISVSE
jgi:hypothetical protein